MVRCSINRQYNTRITNIDTDVKFLALFDQAVSDYKNTLVLLPKVLTCLSVTLYHHQAAGVLPKLHLATEDSRHLRSSKTTVTISGSAHART